MFYRKENGNLGLAEKHARFVNGRPVITWKRDIEDFNILEVEAGTNGYKGGDTGHGSRTCLRLRDHGGTDIHCAVNGKEINDDVRDIEITLGGDAELSTIKEALRWMLSILEIQSGVEG